MDTFWDVPRALIFNLALGKVGQHAGCEEPHESLSHAPNVDRREAPELPCDATGLAPRQNPALRLAPYGQRQSSLVDDVKVLQVAKLREAGVGTQGVLVGFRRGTSVRVLFLLVGGPSLLHRQECSRRRGG